jgi:hypothetical protein
VLGVGKNIVVTVRIAAGDAKRLRIQVMQKNLRPVAWNILLALLLCWRCLCGLGEVANKGR